MTPTFRVQLGVRIVLPIAALVLIGVAAAWGRWWSEQPAGFRRFMLGGIAAACVAWSLTSTWLIWPNGMCYTNELFGGASRGHLVLSESNIDWGQGLPELADWQQQHSDAPLHVWYFGTDLNIYKGPFQPICPDSLSHGEELDNVCRGGYLAASVTYLYGYHHNTPAACYLRSLPPCAQTSTHLIYDFRNQHP